jgi:prepilin-type N-terminal cleavage/methylation domain-containing protein
MRNRRRNFTLVELLVVIGIIAILAGMLMAGIMYAPAKAQKAKSQAEITTLVNAIKQFESAYGVLPIPDGVTSDGELSDGDYDKMITILQADETSSAWNDLSAANKKKNKRRTKFLDIQGNDAGSYTDPWDNRYKVILDADYDGKIVVSSPITGLSVKKETSGTYNNKYVYRYTVIIWGRGSDRKYEEGFDLRNDKKNEDNVYSIPTTWVSSEGHNISK